MTSHINIVTSLKVKYYIELSLKLTLVSSDEDSFLNFEVSINNVVLSANIYTI